MDNKFFLNMKKAGDIVKDTFFYIKDFIKPGTTTEELNKLCHNFIIANKAIPACLNYQGFPKSICTSINDVVCHGIPKETEKLKNGDIINIDLVVNYNGYFADSSRNYAVGLISQENQDILQSGRSAMYHGISLVKAGVNTQTIAKEVERFIQSKGYKSVIDYGAHGIGRSLHQPPTIIFTGEKDCFGHNICPSYILKEGDCITIEPILTFDSREVKLESDNWTVKSVDGKVAVQWEHTVYVTKDGCEILT